MLGAALEVVPRTEADIDKAAQAALRHLSEQRSTWLLVYDNVTAPDSIADLLPSTGARVLITSRFSDWAGCAEEVNLDVLAPEEAVYFLQKRAVRTDETGATILAEALGASGRSPAKKLSMVKRRARAHGRCRALHLE